MEFCKGFCTHKVFIIDACLTFFTFQSISVLATKSVPACLSMLKYVMKLH